MDSIHLGKFLGYNRDLFRNSFASNRTSSEGDPNKFRRRSEGFSNPTPTKPLENPKERRRDYRQKTTEIGKEKEKCGKQKEEKEK